MKKEKKWIWISSLSTPYELIEEKLLSMTGIPLTTIILQWRQPEVSFVQSIPWEQQVYQRLSHVCVCAKGGISLSQAFPLHSWQPGAEQVLSEPL